MFRDAEAAMRTKMIEQDVVECVIGLGPNLFYNSPMEACLLITNNNKPEHKRGKILFINAVKEVRQEKTMSFLNKKHIEKIFNAYTAFGNQDNFAALVQQKEVLDRKGNMAISLYVRPQDTNKPAEESFDAVYDDWQSKTIELRKSMDELFVMLGK